TRWSVALNGMFVASLVLIGSPLWYGYAQDQSGMPLARAIRAAAPGARVRFEYCYSPGTDFVLDRISSLVSRTGRETTSNYQMRYRKTLIARGQWTPQDTIPVEPAEVVVRPARDALAPPAGMKPFYRDRRFVAWRRRGAR